MPREHEEGNREQSGGLNSTTESQANGNNTPVTTTAPPVTTTAPPVTTTAPPVTTTAPPATTTAPPSTGGTGSGTGAGTGTTPQLVAPETTTAPVTAGSTGTDGTSGTGGNAGTGGNTGGTGTPPAGGGAGTGGADILGQFGMQFNDSTMSGVMNFFNNPVVMNGLRFVQGQDVTVSNPINIPNVTGTLFNVAGAKIDSVTFNRSEGIKSASISAGTVGIGNTLIRATAMHATYNASTAQYDVTFGGATLAAFGKSMGLTNLTAKIGKDGNFIEAGAAAATIEGLTINEIKLDREALHLKQVDAKLPPMFGKEFHSTFQDITANAQGQLSGTGTIATTETFSFMDDKLKVENLTSQISVVNNEIGGTVGGQVSYTDPNNVVRVNGLATITVGRTPNFQLANGGVTANLSGMTFTGEGVQFNAAQQVLTMTAGHLNIPNIGENFAVTLRGGKIDATGFSFASLALNTGGGIEILPKLTVAGTIGIRKEGATYTFFVQNGRASVVNGPGGLTASGVVNMTYNETAGTAGTLTNGVFATNFVEVRGNGVLAADGMSIPTVTTKIKGLSPQPLVATATNVKYSKTEGFTVEKIAATLPPIGGTVVTGEINNLKVKDSISVGEVKLAVANNELSLAGGKVKVQAIQGGASLNPTTGAWSFDVHGDLRTELTGMTGNGHVGISYDAATGPKLTITDGGIKATVAGVEMTATGLSFDSRTQQLKVSAANVVIPELGGVQTTATATNVSIGPDGMTGAINVTANGAISLMGGKITATQLSGSFTKDSSGYKFSMKSSVTVNAGGVQGQAQEIKFDYVNGAKSIKVKQLKLNTNYFEATVAEASYADDKIEVASAGLKMKNLDKFGNPNATATNLKYDASGLTIASFQAGLSFEDRPNLVTLNASNIVVPASGNPTGTATLALAQNFSLAGGAVSVQNPTATASLENDGWGMSISGGVHFNTPGATGGGTVTIGYRKTSGLSVAIEGGSLDANFQSLGLRLSASAISYHSDSKTLVIGSGTVNVARIGNTALEGSVSDLRISGSNISFRDLIVRPTGGLNLEIVRGLNVSLNEVKLTKEGNNFSAKLKGGLTLHRDTPRIDASTQVELGYNFNTRAITGSIAQLDIETSVFRTSVRNAQVTSEGLSIASARLGLSQNLTAEALQQYIPGFQPWMLDAVRGVELVAENITYKPGEGLKVGNFYPDIPRLTFDMFGMNGWLDFRQQRGRLEARKDFPLTQFGIPDHFPDIRIPIVPGVVARVRMSVRGSFGFSAAIEAGRNPQTNAWDIAGELGLHANITPSVALLAGVDVGLASASAGLEIAFPLNVDGHARLSGGVRYNPQTRAVEMASPINLSYGIEANLAAELNLLLETEVLMGLYRGSTSINLARWQLGNLKFEGGGQGNNLSQILSSLHNSAKLRVGATGREETLFQS